MLFFLLWKKGQEKEKKVIKSCLGACEVPLWSTGACSKTNSVLVGFCWNVILLCNLDDGEGQSDIHALLNTMRLQMGRIKHRRQEHRSGFMFISLWALVQPLPAVRAGLHLLSKIQDGKGFPESASLIKHTQLESFFWLHHIKSMKVLPLR